MAGEFELGVTVDQTPSDGETEAPSGDPSGASDLKPLARLLPGSVLPGTRLKIVRWLGQGGMGVVFEVRHLDIERRYAAKLLNLESTPQRRQRFQQEARTISQLGSPYIVEVFDFKRLPDGRLLFLMELVDGPSLSQVCRDSGPLALPRLVGLARQVCKGLHDAHERGFVHRDVKPDNLVLGRAADGREQIKLVDFGLATLQGNRGKRRGGGTPAYMSPEQCQGLATDIRSDIYSLGASLYELATASLPFDGEDEASVKRQHLEDLPEPPSSRVEGGLEPGLDALILRCMAKQPEDRYADAVELEAALIELQLELRLRTPFDDLPAPTLDDERRQRQLSSGLAQLLGEDQRRQRRQWGIGAVLLAALGLAAVLGVRAQAQAQQAEQQRHEAELVALRERAEQAAAHACWIYPPADDPAGDTAYRVILDIEELHIQTALDTGSELREQFTTTLIGLGDTYWDAEGGRSFAADFYAQAVVFTPGHERALARSRLGVTELMRLRSRAADGDFSRYELDALRLLQTLADPDEDDRRATLAALYHEGELSERQAAKVGRLLGDPVVRSGDTLAPEPAPTDPEAEAAAERLEDAGETGETGETDDDELATSTARDPRPGAKDSSPKLLASAKRAFDAGRSDEAETLYRKALARSARNVDALVGLHHIHFDRGEYRKALDFVERAVELRPKRASLRMYAGDACVKVLDWTCARKHYRKAKALGVARAQDRLDLVDEQSGE